MSEKKQLAINFIAQILFNVVNLGVSFFLVPHIVETINATAYGFISLSNDFVNYAGIVTVALNSLAGRYITISLHKKKYEEAKKYFNSVFVANAILAGILSILAIVFIIFIDKILSIPIDILGDVRLLFILVFINFLINVVTSVFSVATFATNKLYLGSIVNICTQVLKCLILVIAYGFLPANVWYIGLSALVCTNVASLSNVIFVKKLTPMLKVDYHYFRFDYVMELTKSGIWNTITRLSSIINNGLDLLITNIMVSPVAMGILSLPTNVHSIILNLFSSLGGIFAPKVTASYARGETEEIKKQIKFSYKFLGVFSNTFLTVFMAFGLIFFKLWVPSQDSNLLYLIAVVSCSALIFALPMEPFYNVHTATNKIKTPAIVSSILSLLIIVFVFIGLSLTDNDTIKLIIISSTSTLFGAFRVLLFLPIYTARILDEKAAYFYPLIVKNTVAFIISLSVGLLFNNLLNITNWLNFAIACVLLCIIVFPITLFINFNKYEREQFFNIIKRRFTRKVL